MGILSCVYRLEHSYGYGVQSPSVYYYIKNVLNEHSPYYAYDELLQPSSSFPSYLVNQFRLYFRLANYHQPHVWLDLYPEDDSVRKFVQSGCRHTSYFSIDQMDSLSQVDVARMLNGDAGLYENLLLKFTPHSVLIVNHIRNDSQMLSFWNDIVADTRTGVTLDMYSMGIVFFDNRPKQNYILYLR